VTAFLIYKQRNHDAKREQNFFFKLALLSLSDHISSAWQHSG